MVLIQFRDVSWTRRGESPVDLAVKEGHEEIVALMRAYELVANDPTFARELNSPPVPPPRPAHADTSPVTLTPSLFSLRRYAAIAPGAIAAAGGKPPRGDAARRGERGTPNGERRGGRR
jgi:hypothetical protein